MGLIQKHKNHAVWVLKWVKDCVVSSRSTYTLLHWLTVRWWGWWQGGWGGEGPIRCVFSHVQAPNFSNSALAQQIWISKIGLSFPLRNKTNNKKRSPVPYDSQEKFKTTKIIHNSPQNCKMNSTTQGETFSNWQSIVIRQITSFFFYWMKAYWMNI